MNERKPVGA